VWVAELATGDAYHPSTRGYARLAVLVQPVFLQWLAERVVPVSRLRSARAARRRSGR
jgi:acyl-CoA thioesterase-1